MLVMQLLKSAVRHAGSRPQCGVERLISSSSHHHRISASGRTHPSSCTDADHPKVLITGWFSHILKLVTHFFVCFVSGTHKFLSLFIVPGGLGQLGVGLAKLLRYISSYLNSIYF